MTEAEKYPGAARAIAWARRCFTEAEMPLPVAAYMFKTAGLSACQVGIEAERACVEMRDEEPAAPMDQADEEQMLAARAEFLHPDFERWVKEVLYAQI